MSICSRGSSSLVVIRRVALAMAVSGLGMPIAWAATPAAKDALKLKPLQKDVEYQSPPESETEDCRVLDITEDGMTGWIVQSADGVRLRKFADTNGDKKIDLWCYYDQGCEVYRDVDADFNGKADQYRWLGTEGTRWGLDDNEDGVIDRWRQISAEEVTAEVVAAIANKDKERFVRLLATGSELKAAGVSEALQEKLTQRIKTAGTAFSQLAGKQTEVPATAKWVQFASSVPGIVPKGNDGATKDIKVYENAVAMFSSDDKSGQVMVGTIIQIDEAWRLVDVPQVMSEDQALTQATGVFFSSQMASSALAANKPAMGAETQDLVLELEKIDKALAAAAKPEDKSDLNSRRVDLLEKLISTSTNNDERETWIRQVVDTTSIAAQNGSYPDGVERLKKFSNQLPQNAEGALPYVEYQILTTEYIQKQTPDANFAKVQEWYLEQLNAFVTRFPKSNEAGQALLQLALSKEFEDKKDDALGYYGEVAANFPSTDAGQKATGAIRRLKSEGNTLELRGRTVQGEAFDLSKLAGRPVVIHYWATWCDACKQDMKLLRQLQAKYQSSGLTIVGVNVDATRNDAVAYLKENPAPWIHLYEDGGLESSSLAKQLGVQTLPMMLLIDSSGKVVSNNIYAASLDAEIARIAKAAPRK